MCNITVTYPSSLHGPTHDHNRGFLTLAINGNQGPLSWSDLCQIKFIGIVLASEYATLLSFVYQSLMGILTNIISALRNLWMLQLSNHWANSLQIMLIGTLLNSRCAMAWSLVHQSYICMSTGIISALFMKIYIQDSMSLLHINHKIQSIIFSLIRTKI